MALQPLYASPPPAPVATLLELSPPAGHVQLLPAAGLDPAAEFLKDSGKISLKPNRMGNDVWTVLQEYVKQGGLLNLAEEIASLAELEKQVRDSNMDLETKAGLLIKISDKRTTAKEKYLKVQEAKRDYITFPLFAVFLEDLHRILTDRVGDEVLLKLIGLDLNEAATRLRIRMKGG